MLSTNSKNERKINMLERKIERLEDENNRLRKENDSLKHEINELSSDAVLNRIELTKQYEQDLLSQIEQVKELKEKYLLLVEKQKKFIGKEKGKYKKETNKAITEFKKSLS